jgi:hypothetical protein
VHFSKRFHHQIEPPHNFLPYSMAYKTVVKCWAEYQFEWVEVINETPGMLFESRHKMEKAPLWQRALKSKLLYAIAQSDIYLASREEPHRQEVNCFASHAFCPRWSRHRLIVEREIALWIMVHKKWGPLVSLGSSRHSSPLTFPLSRYSARETYYRNLPKVHSMRRVPFPTWTFRIN